MSVTTECPACKADLRDGEIPQAPEAGHHQYSGATHYSRVIGIYDRDRDRTTHWKCPDCGHEWPRFTEAE